MEATRSSGTHGWPARTIPSDRDASVTRIRNKPLNLFQMAIHVAIVESNLAILSELQQLIDRSDTLRCVCASSSGEDALERIPGMRPQVIIMGVGHPGICGIECTVLLKRALAEAQILIYSSESAVESVSRAFQAGASGYILKRRGHGEIIQAVSDLVRGGAPMTREIARKLVQSLWRKDSCNDSNSLEILTPREEEILVWLASGMVNKEIGDQLSISYDTVRAHLKNVYAKLGVRSRTEAVVKYFGLSTRHQMVHPASRSDDQGGGHSENPSPMLISVG